MKIFLQRGPTDLLKALASTVGVDPGAPKYKFIDDPYFIPASNLAKKSYALSKELGRKAARQFALDWPTLFMWDKETPKIDAFWPRKTPETTEEATETALIRYLKMGHFKLAFTVKSRN